MDRKNKDALRSCNAQFKANVDLVNVHLIIKGDEEVNYTIYLNTHMPLLSNITDLASFYDGDIIEKIMNKFDEFTGAKVIKR